MKLLFVFGTRPEAIKLAPMVRELSARPDFQCKVCVTGQHRELLAQVLDLFGLRPDWNLEIMRPDQDLAYLTGAALSGVAGVLASWRPIGSLCKGTRPRPLPVRLRRSTREFRWRMSRPACAPTTSIRRGLRRSTAGSSATSPIFISPRLPGHAKIFCTKELAATGSS